MENQKKQRRLLFRLTRPGALSIVVNVLPCLAWVAMTWRPAP